MKTVYKTFSLICACVSRHWRLVSVTPVFLSWSVWCISHASNVLFSHALSLASVRVTQGLSCKTSDFIYQRGDRYDPGLYGLIYLPWWLGTAGQPPKRLWSRGRFLCCRHLMNLSVYRWFSFMQHAFDDEEDHGFVLAVVHVCSFLRK